MNSSVCIYLCFSLLSTYLSLPHFHFYLSLSLSLFPSLFPSLSFCHFYLSASFLSLVCLVAAVTIITSHELYRSAASSDSSSYYALFVVLHPGSKFLPVSPITAYLPHSTVSVRRDANFFFNTTYGNSKHISDTLYSAAMLSFCLIKSIHEIR